MITFKLLSHGKSSNSYKLKVASEITPGYQVVIGVKGSWYWATDRRRCGPADTVQFDAMLKKIKTDEANLQGKKNSMRTHSAPMTRSRNAN